jgi:four helix bundle protein
MQDFRKLDVWHEAHAHLLKVREATHRFPRSGYATVKKQLIGSTESIPFNIVEGCGAFTQKEFARFLDISIKSTSECEYQLELVKDYGILSALEWEGLAKKTVIIRKMLCKLRARVLESLEETDETDRSDESDEDTD